MKDRIARVVVRHPLRVVVVTLLVAMVFSVALKNLEFRTSQDTLVSSSTQVYKDNARYQQQFGGETMLVLITGDPVGLFTPDNSTRLQQLESDLRATPGVDTVVGPYTAMKYAADQLTVAPQLLADASARAADPAAFQQRVASEMARLGAAGEQTLSNPEFVKFLLFDGNGTVRQAQQTAFPDAGHSLVVVRITGNASIDEQATVSHAVKDVVDRYRFPGYTTLSTGTPVLLDEINSYLQGGMASLGLIAVIVMLVILALTFHVRLRLLPLAVVAVGTAAALGMAVLVDIPLSLVTISGLPIFIGLGVDFAIQVHNRYDEQRRHGDDAREAATVAIAQMITPLTVAMVAGAFGFIALRLSSVPMIRDFGLLLCLGVLVLVTVALLLPPSILVLADRRQQPFSVDAIAKEGRVERVVRRMTMMRRSFVAAFMVIGVVVAAAGFAVEKRMPIETEAEKWVSPTGSAVKELEALRSEIGFSTELGVMVQAPDVTSDDVVAWIHRFETTEMERHQNELLQVASMPGVAADVVGIAPTGKDVNTLLALAPRDIGASLVSADKRTANIVFPVGNISLGDKGKLIDSIKADLKGDLAPPAGVTVTPSGLAVIGIELVRGMEANRQTLTLVALALVAAWLLVRGRLRVRALLPLAPIAIAVGVATFVVWQIGFTLTPLTTVAAPLVIAVATEFTVLLEARYTEERHRGCSPFEACHRGMPRIGKAFFASGLTLMGGFAVMAASPMPLLRDFGIVVAIDVLVALVCALIIMPPLLRWSDRHAEIEVRVEVVTERILVSAEGGQR
jgi:hydrophobe/amphiphile efflux-3 (HAE3) family protein